MNKMTPQGNEREMKYLSDEQKELINSFPGLSADELEQVNNLYQHYVFYKALPEGWEVSTSCCHKGKQLLPFLKRTMTAADSALFQFKHNDDVRCPFCGKAARLKNLKMIKTGARLREDHEVVFWHHTEDTVYAQCYWTRKDYGTTNLTAEPLYLLSLAFAFQPGRATLFYKRDGQWGAVVEEGAIGKNIQICEPFWLGGYMSGYQHNYTDINRDTVLRESWLKYSCLGEWDSFPAPYRKDHHALPMKYLALYCVYPHAVEMLYKNGLEPVINDFVYNGKKNAKSIKWDETDPRRAFGLNGQELKAFMAIHPSQRKIRLVDYYKRSKKRRWNLSFPELSEICDLLHGNLADEKQLFALCRKHRINPRKLLVYFDRYVSKCSRGGGFYTLKSVMDYWKDYLDAAEAIELDIKNPVVLMPKNLKKAHDSATKEHNRRLDAEAEKKCEEVKLKYERLYAWSDGEYFIRPAASSREIIQEGKALHHCVGGYADRHIEGKIAILFMRRCCTPEESYVTIEMQGKTLRQMHGYKNDFAKTPARELHASFIEQWLAWVERGSKRDANGKPVAPKKKTKTKREVQAA